MMHRRFVLASTFAPLQCNVWLLLLLLAFSKKEATKREQGSGSFSPVVALFRRANKRWVNVNDAPTFSFGILVCPTALPRMAAAAAANVFRKRGTKKRARQRQLLASCGSAWQR